MNDISSNKRVGGWTLASYDFVPLSLQAKIVQDSPTSPTEIQIEPELETQVEQEIPTITQVERNINRQLFSTSQLNKVGDTEDSQSWFHHDQKHLIDLTESPVKKTMTLEEKRRLLSAPTKRTRADNEMAYMRMQIGNLHRKYDTQQCQLKSAHTSIKRLKRRISDLENIESDRMRSAIMDSDVDDDEELFA